MDEAGNKERPQRLLIKIIQGFPHAIIHQICPFTAKVVRPIVKMPMVTLLITSGCVVALNLACFTFIGELLQSGSLFDDPWLIVFLLIFGILASISLLLLTNFVNSIYD